MEARLLSVLLVLVCWVTISVSQTTVHKLSFRSDIQFRFATTEVMCVMSNDRDTAEELTFDVTLPQHAFITNFSMVIEGKEYPGNVKEKREARKEYLHALQHGHSGGLVEQKPRHSNQFEVSVNIAAGHNVTFNLMYQELLRRRFGTYEHTIHIDNNMQVNELSIMVFVQERTEIKDVRTPAMRKELTTNAVSKGSNSFTEITHPTPNTAYVVYHPTPEQLKEAGGGWFVVQYDVASDDAGEILVVDGYFVHYFVPPSDLPPLPLDIVFVLDISGSMSGVPIQQLREAMNIILADLRTTDRFNILLFDDQVEIWESRLQEASPSTVARAKDYVSRITARRSTDLHKALTRGLEMLQSERGEFRVPMLFFLTDGEATSGIQDSGLIVQMVTELNKRKDVKGMANIYSLAFGRGADYNLLKQVSAKNNGFSRRIYEGADASLQVSGLYKEIATVVLRGLTIEYHSSTSDQGGEDIIRVDNNTVTVCTFPTIFSETDAVVAGKIDNMELLQPGDSAALTMVVSGQGYDGQKVNLVLTENDVTELTLSGKGDNPLWSVPRDLAKITERAWAYLTIQQLLEQKVAAEEDKNLVKELDAKILELSLRYHFVTPLTSMVVTRPEDDPKEVKKATANFDDRETPRGAPPRVQAQSGMLAHSTMSHFQPVRQAGRKASKWRRPSYGSLPTLPALTSLSNFADDFKVDSEPFLPPPATTWPQIPPATVTWSRARSTAAVRVQPPVPDAGTGKPAKRGKGHGHRGSNRGPKRTKICQSEKKVIMEAVIAEGLNMQKKCAEVRSGRTKTTYRLLQHHNGYPVLTVSMTKNLISAIAITQNNDIMNVYVTPNGSVAHNVSGTSPNFDVLPYSNGSLLAVNTALYKVSFRVTNTNCKATWLRIEVELRGSRLSELRGVIVDLLEGNLSATGNGRQKQGKRRRKRPKAKPSKMCAAIGVPPEDSSVWSYRLLKRHLYTVN